VLLLLSVIYLARSHESKKKNNTPREKGERETRQLGFWMLELSRLIDRRSSSRVRREQSRESTSSGGEMPADSLKYRRPQMIRPELCSTPVYRIEEEKENVKKLFFRFQSISVFFFVGIFAWGRLFQLILRSVKSSRRKLDD
jgi:hypothetical protein